MADRTSYTHEELAADLTVPVAEVAAELDSAELDSPALEETSEPAEGE